jgi:hypothetical protein
MAIPGENFVLRLHEKEGTLIHMNVLDLAVTSATERVALVEWAYGIRATADTAGFSILRFDPLGKVLGQISKTLCSFSGIECGNFQLETGFLIPLIDGFLVAGTATNIYTGVQHPIAMRMDNAGNVRWTHQYVADVGHPTTAKITSIVPLQTPNRYLISAVSSDDETWLFQIDGGSGFLTSSRLASFARLRRLRMTSLGVLAVGETNPLITPEPVILALDSMTASPLWIRTFTWADEGPDTGVRWFDIAEGSDVLLVVGNVVGHVNEVSPMMAFLDKHSLPTPGDIIKILVPTLGADPVRLRAVINHQDLVIPLKGGDVYSAFCVTGDVKQQPWSFAIAEDQTLLWQKKLRIPATSTGREVPVIWASYEEIISGGFVTTGSTPRGFITSSPVTNGRGTTNCSEETTVTFPKGTLYEHRPLPEDEPLAMRTLDWSSDQGRDLDVKMGCLDLQ